MVIRFLLFFSFSLLLTLNYSAQKTKKISARKQGKIEAKKQINELQKGVLLVRLKTKEKTIEAMKKSGKLDLALKTENKLKNRNTLIIKAFKNSFKFCPIYFIYSTDSKHVRNNNLDSVEFLNDDLTVNKSIKITNPYIYIAEFGNIEPSQTISYQYSADPPINNNKNTYNGSTNFSFKAVVIKDKMFNQLRDPFPYYVKEATGFNEGKHINSAILSLNAKLFKFYKKQNKQ